MGGIFLATNFTEIIKNQSVLSNKQKINIIIQLSIPTILSQVSSILMQYIDAAMVGHLGPDASASIGIVSTSSWLLSGLCSAMATSFAVQVAQLIGASQYEKARRTFKTALITSLIFSCILLIIGVLVNQSLLTWLGADPAIFDNASAYFLVFTLSLPILQLNSLCSSMLQCSGNMKIPSLLNASMCGLDVIYNLIFIHYFGVVGAAIGTALAQLTVCFINLWYTTCHSSLLKFQNHEKFYFEKETLKNAFQIGTPLAFEHIAICGAMVMSTKIIAPLGTIAIAAHSFAITAESLCYMPGYGLESAATTLVGQCMGAQRKELAKSFSNLTVAFGAIIMGIIAIVMFVISPFVFQILTPDVQTQQLATEVLRIELFAEPLYGVSIVASGALRGAGDTLIPSLLNLLSIWGVRLSLSVLFVQTMGLHGVWLAMCIELCVRGLLLLYRQQRGQWLEKSL